MAQGIVSRGTMPVSQEVKRRMQAVTESSSRAAAPQNPDRTTLEQPSMLCCKSVPSAAMKLLMSYVAIVVVLYRSVRVRRVIWPMLRLVTGC